MPSMFAPEISPETLPVTFPAKLPVNPPEAYNSELKSNLVSLEFHFKEGLVPATLSHSIPAPSKVERSTLSFAIVIILFLLFQTTL